MVFVKLTEDHDSDLIKKLKIDINSHKFGLVPYKTLQENVDSFNN